MTNEEKILAALSQIQGDISNLKANITELQEDVKFVRGVTVRMENDHGKKLDALFDGYSANYDLIGRYDPRVTKLERDLEKLSFEVKYLKAAK